MDETFLDDPETCPIHAATLVYGKVDVQYGLMIHSDEQLHSQERLFPYANSFVNGGCIIEIDTPQATVRFCPECRRAEQDWLEHHT